MILYYAPTACSLAVHAALEEAGLPFEPRAIDFAAGEQTSPDYLKVNPRGRVPALVVDGQVVTEVPALLTYVAGLSPEAGLVPPPGTLAHARCFEWLGFLSSTLHVAYAQYRRPQRFLAEESACREQLAAEGRDITIALYREVEQRLGPGWAAGQSRSIADLYLLPVHFWAWRLDLDMAAECPKWTALVRRLAERPGVKRALEREGLTL